MYFLWSQSNLFFKKMLNNETKNAFSLLLLYRFLHFFFSVESFIRKYFSSPSLNFTDDAVETNP